MAKIRSRYLYLALAATMLWTSCATKQFTQASRTYDHYEINQDLAPDARIVRYYEPFKKQLEAEMAREIGYSEVALTRPRDQPETLLGNFFAESLLHAGDALGAEAVMAVGTKGGLRRDLPQGTLTLGHLYELMPFENSLVALELRGEDVERLAHFIAKTGGQPVAGIRFEIRNERAVNISVQGQPLQTASTYKIITYDFLANGGDHIEGFEQPLNRIEYPEKVRDVLISHIKELHKQGKSINTQLDGRIRYN